MQSLLVCFLYMHSNHLDASTCICIPISCKYYLLKVFSFNKIITYKNSSTTCLSVCTLLFKFIYFFFPFVCVDFIAERQRTEILNRTHEHKESVLKLVGKGLKTFCSVLITEENYRKELFSFSFYAQKTCCWQHVLTSLFYVLHVCINFLMCCLCQEKLLKLLLESIIHWMPVSSV